MMHVYKPDKHSIVVIFLCKQHFYFSIFSPYVFFSLRTLSPFIVIVSNFKLLIAKSSKQMREKKNHSSQKCETCGILEFFAILIAMLLNSDDKNAMLLLT